MHRCEQHESYQDLKLMCRRSRRTGALDMGLGQHARTVISRILGCNWCWLHPSRLVGSVSQVCMVRVQPDLSHPVISSSRTALIVPRLHTAGLLAEAPAAC